MKKKTNGNLKLWSVGNGRFFAYTEDLKLKNKVEKIDGIKLIGSYHSQKGKLIAHQFVVENEEVKEMLIQIANDQKVAENKKQLSLF